MLREALYKSGSNFEVEEKKHLERYGSSAILNTRNVRILREKTVVIPNLAEKSRNFCPYSRPGSKPVKKLLLDFEHTESGMLGFNSSVPKPACWPIFQRFKFDPHHHMKALPDSRLSKARFSTISWKHRRIPDSTLDKFLCQREKKRMSWTWFLLQLIKDVNASSKRTLTFISDEQKGLVLTFEEVFGGMEHRLCVRHMYNNFKKKFPGIHLKDLFWRIASASYEKQWERAMKELKEVDRLAFEWVESKPKEKWCKHKCKVHSKCDTLVNNMCELFNEGQSNRKDRDSTSASASASAAASKQLGSTAQATASAHSGSNAHAQSKASVHGHSTASATATARISSASSIARANVETSPSVPPEVKRSKNKGKSIVTSRGRIQPRVSNLPLPKIYGPPPSWRLQASISRETLMATSQSARYREAFHILGS
uniref:MULE transposase domain-containing protein n=1 Tax=Fagus sylvatica TaxID=28930 RepID=A0A2N9H3B3_FAGSY